MQFAAYDEMMGLDGFQFFMQDTIKLYMCLLGLSRCEQKESGSLNAVS